jgi:hypothetical protein
MVFAKECQVGILDVEDRFKDGAEREAMDRGHVVVEKRDPWANMDDKEARSRDTTSRGQNLKTVHEGYLDLFCNIN